MKLTLSSDAGQMIQEQLRSKKFVDAEAVILAGLKSLSAAAPDEFEPGEMQALLDEGEQSIANEGTLDADEALAARRANRQHPKSGAHETSNLPARGPGHRANLAIHCPRQSDGC